MTILKCQRSLTTKNVIDRRHGEPSGDPHFLHIYQYLKLRFSALGFLLTLIDKLSRGHFRFPKGETGAYRRIRGNLAVAGPAGLLPTTRRPVGAADAHAAASAPAKALAGKSDNSDFVGEHDYWWGHDKDTPQLYRYVIRPV
jgi:hypothetical protein